MKKRGVILLLSIFVISTLIVVFNSYNISNPIISENSVDTKTSVDQKILPKTSAIDPFEPNNDSGTAFFITEGYYTNLNLSSNSDEDWFYIWIDFDKTLIINIYFSTSNGDINLELYNSSINLLTGSYSITDDESISFIITNSDNYYFRIFNEANSYYELEIKIDDKFEPNNVFSNAYDIGLGWYGSLECKDDDWFKFWIAVGQQFTVDLYFNNSFGNLDMDLSDDLNNVLLIANSIDDNETIIWTAGYSGYYFIYIYNFAVDNIYDLDIYISGFSEDVYEENDDFSSAWDISIGSYSPLACKDDDWFRFWMNNGEQFTVDIYFSHGISDLDLELSNDLNVVLTGSYSVDNDEHITWTAGYSGYYYVRIYNLGVDNAYALDIKMGTSGEDPFEENDIFNDAWELPPGYHSNLYCQDDDWFKVWLHPGDQIIVDIYFNNDSGNLDLQFYDDAYVLLTWSYSITDDESVSWFASYDGFYYIRIFNYGQANYYDLDIKMFYDPYEPNNDFFSAAELYRGSHYNLWCRDDDWFKCRVNSSEQFFVNIHFEHVYGNLDMEIYDYNNIMLWQLNSWDDDEFIAFTATYTGYYYIRVYNQSASDENWYVLILGGPPELIFQEDFEGPISSKWSGFGGGNYWHVTTRDYSPLSPTHSLWCGNEISGTYDKGIGVPYKDTIVITDLDLRDYCFAALHFDFKYTTGTTKEDEIGVSAKVLGEQFYLNPRYTDNDFTLINRFDNSTGWENVSYDLSFFCGYEHVDIIFYFKANDFDNDYEGVMIDNIRIEGIVDNIPIGNSLGIEVEDEYYYYISYIDNKAWSNEIFGRGIFWGDAYVKIEIFAIYDMGSYWDVVARFWEPWDDFDDLANTEEVHYNIYKNPLNMKDGADLFIPYNDIWTYLDKADNYDWVDWFGNYDIHHWYDNYWNQHLIEFSYDDFRVHLIYSNNGILVGMMVFKNDVSMYKIFEMWRSDYSDDDDEEDEEERDAIPGYDIPIVITLVSIVSIISAIRIKKLRKI